MRSFIIAAIAALAFAGASASAASMASLHHGATTAVPACGRAKLCGHTCIARNKICYQPIGITVPPNRNLHPPVENANKPH